MALTPENVRNANFATVHLREGYSQKEVNDFLHQAEAELIRLQRINEELHVELITQALSGVPQPGRERQEAHETGSPTPAERAQHPPHGSNGNPALTASALSQQSVPEVGSGSAARLLALAQQTADLAVAEARTQARQIVGEARTQAQGLQRDARAKADALEHNAQAKHRLATNSLKSTQAALQHKIKDLHGFEREYRIRLTAYLQAQLRQMEHQADDTLAPSRTPALSGVTARVSSRISPAIKPAATTHTPTPLRPSRSQAKLSAACPTALPAVSSLSGIGRTTTG
ncbi:DivIVA domain-containing protein [Streptomyces sp. NPDC059718]